MDDCSQQRNGNISSSRSVQFNETSQQYTYTHQNIAYHELWYTQLEFDLMKLAIRDEVLYIREARTSRDRGAVDDDDASSSTKSPCYMGIEHLLTPACTNEVRARRARCRRAVLAEQAKARSAPKTRFSWETIALASFAETRQAVLRARKFGKLHHDSI